MSDVIGRGIIEVQADASGVTAGMAAAGRAVENFERTAVKSASTAGQALSKTGDGADVAAGKLDASTKRFIASLEREIAAISLSRSEYRQWEAQVKGIADTVYGPLIARLSAAKAAQEGTAQAALDQAQAQRAAAEASKALAQAQREADQTRASQAAFLSGLREQVALQGRNTEEVLRYRAAQAGVGSEAAPLILQLQNMRAAQEKLAQAARDEAQAQKDAAQAVSSRQNFIQSLRSQSDAIGKTRADLLEMQAAQMGVTTQAAPFIARLREADKTVAGVGMSAKATAAALRGVPAQLTDIVVSLQGGQAPLTVLLQQGGQLRDMFGSVGGAAKALGGVLGSVLLNPLVIAGAALAALTYGFVAGRQESQEYGKSLILTGNAAGTTVARLQDAAKAVSAIVGTQGAAAEALNALAGSGRVSGSADLEKFATATLLAQRATGAAVADTVKQFAELGKEPVTASRRLNEESNYLTLTVYKQIKALQDAGRASEAASLAQNAYADSLKNRSNEITGNLGSIERGWNLVKSAIKGAADALLALGRTQSAGDRISELQTSIAARESGRGLMARGGKRQSTQDVETDSMRAELAALQETQRLAGRLATTEKERAAATKAGIDFEELREKYLTRESRLAKEIADANALADRAGASQQDRAAVLAGIRQKYSGGIDTDANALAKARAAKEIAEIEAAEQKRLDVIRAAQITQEALRQAGLVGEEDYYAQERKFIENSAASLREKLRQEIATKEALKFTGKDAAREKEANDAVIIALQRKLDSSLSESQVRADAVDIARDAARRRRIAGYAEEARAAQDAADATLRAYQLDLSTSRLGDAARQQTTGRSQIEEKYRADQARAEALIDSQRKRGGGSALTEQEEDYRHQIELITNFKEVALAQFDDYYLSRRRQDADSTVGFDRALNNYLEAVSNTAVQSQRLFERAFQGIEDSLVTLVTTGKFSFSNLANSIIADIIRIQTRAAVAGLLQYFAGGDAGIVAGGSSESSTGEYIRGRRAAGGPVSSGGAYIVGERGPEVFVPSASGTILPNSSGSSAAASSGPRVIIENHGARVEQRTEGNGDLRIIIDAAVAEVDRRIAAGGSTSRALKSRGVRLDGALPSYGR